MFLNDLQAVYKVLVVRVELLKGSHDYNEIKFSAYQLVFGLKTSTWNLNGGPVGRHRATGLRGIC